MAAREPWEEFDLKSFRSLVDGKIARANDVLDQFVVELQAPGADAANVFWWSSATVEHACIQTVATEILRLILAYQETDEGKDPENMRAYLERSIGEYVVHGARYPHQNSSSMARTVEMYKLAAWADFYTFVR